MADMERSLDGVFGALAHQHRRYALVVLADHETRLTLLDLANEIMAREHVRAIDDLSEEMVENIHLDLYHRHVPKLADVGLVEYDRETNFVYPVESTEPLLSHLPEATPQIEENRC